MELNLVLLVAGIALLYGGAESLVKGSIAIARGLGISPAMIGLTLIAFGTSVPEITVSALASYQGTPGVALGNIIGSNIANIGLVVGLVALIRPIGAEREMIKWEMPAVFVVTISLYLMMLDGTIGRVDGIVLAFGMMAFLFIAYKRAARERMKAGEIPRALKRPLVGWIFVLVGIGAVVFGGHLFLKAAVFMARHFGIRELFIGVTLVALGTSLPELATSFVAAIRRHDGLCLSTVLGSNIVNVLFGLALAAIINPIPVPEGVLKNEMLFMIGFSALLLPFARTGYRIGRLEAAVLLIGYAVFVYSSYLGL
jgi:cation:H+ antiporter